MVKKLYTYANNNKNYVFYYGTSIFESPIILEKDKYGNKKYFVITPDGDKLRIYSNGRRRASVEDGFFILGQDRIWKEIADLL